MPNLSKTLLGVVCLVTMIAVVAPAALAGTTLQGGVKKSEINENRPGTSLTRGDMGNTKDVFNDNAAPGDAGQPPSFKLDTVRTGDPPAKDVFDLKADGSGDPSDLEPLVATPAQQPTRTETITPQSPQVNAKDPESSGSLKIAWDEWHKRVGAAVFERFSLLANEAFAHSRPLAAVATYTVTRNGQIMNVRLTQPNLNPMYNAIVFAAVNSLNGNLAILQYPQGSRRMTVDKAGTFIQNATAEPTNRYKVIQGDDETITPH